MAKIPKYLLNMAGEYRVCIELQKRGLFATLTYGNRKCVDVYAISDRRKTASQALDLAHQVRTIVLAAAPSNSQP
jgi:hypothetical protein